MKARKKKQTKQEKIKELKKLDAELNKLLDRYNSLAIDVGYFPVALIGGSGP